MKFHSIKKKFLHVKPVKMKEIPVNFSNILINGCQIDSNNIKHYFKKFVSKRGTTRGLTLQRKRRNFKSFEVFLRKKRRKGRKE